ncbi:hypothetical protein CKM354_000389400 [Cercospora kikuchii]|uniref:Uncharacterized protein n=1 Tax=Cercospora kikuchii TaxID=84275 RepID=A0A9P3FFK0_9PEZI|nr:uncharacterized protein CKM354_000389400 [Cercospora kikuchii]GIZ40560.1 hypothetical protein CKM354_000389400 [Cercospora kikuchii]
MPVESLRPAHDLAHSTAVNNTDGASSYNASFVDAYDHASQQSSSHGGAASPIAPAYSPITPKVQPVLPAYSAPAFANAHHGAEFTFAPVTEQQQQQRRSSSGSPHTQQQHVPAMVPAQGQTLAKSIETQPAPKPARIPPTEYIPQPANLPFSGEDSGDAIALRAAISTLQIQKKKAQDDIKTLATIKQLALEDPATFHKELAAGRLREQKPSLRDILDNMEDDDDDDEEEVALGASREEDQEASQRTVRLPSEIPDSQPSQSASGDIDMDAGKDNPPKQFPRIPAPQNVVRMPHINWDKYGIVGHPLDDLHEQQRKWPGTLGGSDGEKRREFAIAAPYSPWEDKLHDQQPGQAHVSTPDALDGGIRKDSGAPVPSATGTISEHIMETRSRN